MEFMFDTTRSIASLITSGTVNRCPGITFLMCHCGATLPPIISRIAEFSKFLGGNAVTEKEIKDVLQTRFYIDLAGVPFPDQIHGMLRAVDTSRLVYGSDYPYTPAPAVGALAKRLDDNLEESFGSGTAQKILSKNSKGLMSQFRPAL
jgi:predicted TIM-barrel fold metal-dependent hydrolase